MKRIIDFAKGIHPIEWLIIIAVVVVLGCVVRFAVNGIGSAVNEAKISKLESEKQQALKERDKARENDLILQGQIKAKDEQIANLTSQIEDSNQRVSNAHNETVSAKASYDQVRRNPPRFNSSDDAGRVVELGADLQRLYSDTP